MVVVAARLRVAFLLLARMRMAVVRQARVVMHLPLQGQFVFLDEHGEDRERQQRQPMLRWWW